MCRPLASKRIIELINKIEVEHNSEKLIALTTELRALLAEEITRIEGRLAKVAERFR